MYIRRCSESSAFESIYELHLFVSCPPNVSQRVLSIARGELYAQNLMICVLQVSIKIIMFATRDQSLLYGASKSYTKVG